MKDIIDERNEKERIGRSIIKRWNVNYVCRPQEVSSQPEEKDALKLKRLQKSDNTFNAKTGSHSGLYGQNEVDQVHRGQIEKILQEKTKTFQDMLEQEQGRK